MHIAIVGNAPLASDCSGAIDAADFVVRFNMCNNYGSGGGTRTDALVFSNTGKTGRRFADPAVLARIGGFPGADQIWLTRNRAIYDARKARYCRLHLSRRLANTDFAPQILAQTGAKQVVIFGAGIETGLDAKLKDLGAPAHTMPSAGMLAIEYVLQTMAAPETPVMLYGFTHRGIAEHHWESEKLLTEAYIRAGRLCRAPQGDAL